MHAASRTCARVFAGPRRQPLATQACACVCPRGVPRVCVVQVLADVAGVLGPVPPRQALAYDSVREVYGCARMQLASLPRELLDRLITGTREEPDFYQVRLSRLEREEAFECLWMRFVVCCVSVGWLRAVLHAWAGQAG
jgi:hypothetical protein